MIFDDSDRCTGCGRPAPYPLPEGWTATTALQEVRVRCPACPPRHATPVEGPAGDPEHGGSRVDDHRAPTVPAPPPDPPTERMDE